MRYRDFKIAEAKLKEQFDPNDPNSFRVGDNIISAMLPYLPDDVEGGDLTQDQVNYMRQQIASRNTEEPEADAEETNGLEAGPPYPPEQMDAVRAMQTKLEALGYSVGSTGIDGKYGPRTSRAVSAYKRDFNVQDTDRGRSIDAREIQAMQSREPVQEPTPTGNEGRSSGGSFNYADAVPIDDLEPRDDMLDGRESNAATIRFNNPGGMYPAGWQSRFGGEDTGARIGGGHPIAMFPDRVSGAAALFALLDGSLYVNRSVAGALDKWTGSNNAEDYVDWMRARGIDTSETIGNYLARSESAIALAILMARWETGHPYPMSRADWESAYRRSGVAQ